MKDSTKTEEELIRSAGLTEEQYDGIDLGRFIDDFAITEENVDSLNIPLLLEEYMPGSWSGMEFFRGSLPWMKIRTERSQIPNL